MSMYTTSKLLAVTQKDFKFQPLFLSLFFHETYTFDTQLVNLALIPGDVEMAVYISPTVEGKVLRTRGGLTRQFQPGHVKPKHEVTADMLIRRLPDEDPAMLKDPAYNRVRLIKQNLKDEELSIQQVEERQAVDAVLKGRYIMTGEQFEPVEVDMQRSPGNNIIQFGAGAWSTRDRATFDPTDDIEQWALSASGVINIIVMDPKAWALFRSFKAVKEKLDTRRGSNSVLETAVKDLGDVVSYKGMLGDVSIVVYSGQHIENGVKKNYLPDLTLVMGNTMARGIRTYGGTQDIEIIAEGVTKGTRFPKNWIQRGDVSREYTMTASAPLMLLADADEFVSVQLA